MAGRRLGERLLRCEPGDVLLRAGGRKRECELVAAVVVRFYSYLRPDAAEHLSQPRACLVEPGLDAHEGAGVPFQKCHVRAVTTDGHVNRQRPAALRGPQRLAHERRLPVPPGRNQEDLLSGQQIARQPIQLRLTIDEGYGRHDFAVDERVGHRSHVTLNDVTVTEFNVMAGRAQGA